MWVLSPFIFAENTLAEIAHLVVPTGWFFPAAATCFFLFFSVRWEFALLSLLVLEFTQDSPAMVWDWTCIQSTGLPQQRATRFPAVTLAALVLVPPLPHPWGNKGRNQCCLFCQWSWYALRGLELVTVRVCCVMWEVLTEICEIMGIIVI